MEGLRIAKPAAFVEGENINVKVLANQEARRKRMRRNMPIVEEEEEEVWSVPIPNISNVNDEEIYANNKTPVRKLKYNYNWIFNKPETPKAQTQKKRGGRRKMKRRSTQRRNRKY